MQHEPAQLINQMGMQIRLDLIKPPLPAVAFFLQTGRVTGSLSIRVDEGEVGRTAPYALSQPGGTAGSDCLFLPHSFGPSNHPVLC